jgi:hypothetical protein
VFHLAMVLSDRFLTNQVLLGPGHLLC